MAVYTILSVDVLPACAEGQRHLAKASLMVDESPGGVAPIARLLALRAQGSRFVAAGAAEAGAERPVDLVLCACGLGYLLAPAGMVEEYPVHFHT
jgi:hypothetical protein